MPRLTTDHVLRFPSSSLKPEMAASDTGESSLHVSFPPPPTIRKPEMRSLAGPFFFLVQRGLAMPSDFRRLAVGPKSVSERLASLSTRPLPKSRRIQELTYFPMLVRNGLRRGSGGFGRYQNGQRHPKAARLCALVRILDGNRTRSPCQPRLAD